MKEVIISHDHLRMPNYSLKIDWGILCGATEQISICSTSNECNVRFSLNKEYPHDILDLNLFKNGIYSLIVMYGMQKRY